MDPEQHYQNRSEFPLEELEKYVGQYVAWSADGRSILASDEDQLRLIDAIDAMGIDRGETVISYVFEDDGSLIMATVEA